VRRLFKVLLFLLPALLAAGCARGPDQQGLERDVQARLDGLFGGQVLVLRELNRQGSAPYAAAADGASRAIVYYNATLEFAKSYDPSNWESLSPQLIASALGATDEGIVGLGSGAMQPGAQLRAYGSIIYRRDGRDWRPAEAQVPSAALPAAGVAERAPGSRADQLIRRLAEVVDTSPGLKQAKDEIVAEELDRALQNIALRLDTGKQGFAVATGPEGGEYARFVASLDTRFGSHEGPGKIRAAYTVGSVANAFMVDRGEARLGLVQSDVAADAVTGDGLFAVAGPLRKLRAVAALFPEPVHVVVRADSDLRSMGDLAGRRIVLGNVGSGTRHTALRVLAAHGLQAKSYTEVQFVDAGQALGQLADGSVDAVIEVISAPWGQLSQVAPPGSLRLLSLDPLAITTIEETVHGIVHLDIPARTYPGQDEPVHTVAATALLVANSDIPDAIVASVLETMFAASATGGAGVSAARLSPANARVGVTIPLHDGAAGYFDRLAPAAAAGDAP
jgi:TRAP transporter TAXI family solute receptor